MREQKPVRFLSVEQRADRTEDSAAPMGERERESAARSLRHG